MFFSFDLINLILYCTQQLGVTLGVGAETIMLAAYLISMQDGVVDEKETQYARAIKRVMSVALMLIVISGIGITVLHAMAGESAIIFSPAYLFKWLLVLLIIGLTRLRKATLVSVVEGVIGGTWYALFLVHILAPVTGWINLGTLYIVWLIGFVICWEALVLLRRDKKTNPAAPKSPVPAPIVKKAEPVIDTTPKPTIILGADLHVTPTIKVSSPVSPPPPPSLVVIPPAPPVIKAEKKITMDYMPPASSTPLPAGKVTDTPFLPAVPALQPIPVAPMTSQPVELAPLSNITTPPGGTSAGPGILTPEGVVPSSNGGTGIPLSALNVMPKKPADINVPK